MPDSSSTESLIRDLLRLQTKPPLFEPGEPRFWDDPYISEQLLAAHLSPDVEAASRHPETIERSVEWIISEAGLSAGDNLLDMGCGPGLYATRFAERGLRVTGLDFSRRSIDYARNLAIEKGTEITFEYTDYLTMDFEDAFDAVCLIYGEYCVFSREQRSELLTRVKRALKPGGRFVLDVSTRRHRQRYGLGEQTWYAGDSGLWRGEPHLVLKSGFDYPSELTHVDQYIVLDADGTWKVYRFWFRDHTPATISADLEQAGFKVQGIWSDLCGTPCEKESEWIGVIAVAP